MEALWPLAWGKLHRPRAVSTTPRGTRQTQLPGTYAAGRHRLNLPRLPGPVASPPRTTDWPVGTHPFAARLAIHWGRPAWHLAVALTTIPRPKGGGGVAMTGEQRQELFGWFPLKKHSWKDYWGEHSSLLVIGRPRDTGAQWFDSISEQWHNTSRGMRHLGLGKLLALPYADPGDKHHSQSSDEALHFLPPFPSNSTPLVFLLLLRCLANESLPTHFGLCLSDFTGIPDCGRPLRPGSASNDPHPVRSFWITKQISPVTKAGVWSFSIPWLECIAKTDNGTW